MYVNVYYVLRNIFSTQEIAQICQIFFRQCVYTVNFRQSFPPYGILQRNGIVSAIQHFKKQFAPNSLKESTIRGCMEKSVSDSLNLKPARLKQNEDCWEENGPSSAAGQPAG